MAHYVTDKDRNLIKVAGNYSMADEKDWTILYDTAITSTGDKTLTDSIANYKTLCFVGYYISGGTTYYYVSVNIPVWQFKYVDSGGLLISFSTSRYVTVRYVNDTTIHVPEVENMYILRIFGK